MTFIQTYNHLDKLLEELPVYYRVEVFNNQGIRQGGLFRGLNQLVKDLWNADDERYDRINEPLSKLEYTTPYPDCINNPKIKFAYKQDVWSDIVEDIKDIEAELLEIGWSVQINKITQPKKVIYEDDVQIAYII